jgi:deoxyribodipyrimidine photo-lyase
VVRRTTGAEAWLSELAWRESFFTVLAARPDVVGGAFRPEYDALAWNDDEAMFDAWRAGRIGYPLVDAAMRGLEARGRWLNGCGW